jgi:hypothetical protein
MDVDVAEVSDKQKERCNCFYCQKTGHLKKDCHKRIADEAKGNKTSVHVKKAEIIDEDKEDAKGELRKMFQTMGEEEKRSLLSSLVDEHF